MKASHRSLVALALLVLAISAASTWWAGRQQAGLGAQVAALAQPGDIHMLSSETCSVCVVARAWFAAHHVAYSECTIERDAACKAAFEATRAPGTPVLLVRGRPQVGFSPERLRDGLGARG
jgi:glutaredoxin